MKTSKLDSLKADLPIILPPNSTETEAQIKTVKAESAGKTRVLSLTLKGVEDGEDVHEGQVDRAPGEEGEAPGQPEEEANPQHAAHVLQSAAVSAVVRVLLFYPPQLHQHHHEDDDVKEKDEAEVGHHRDVEGYVVPQPAAGEGEGQGKPTRLLQA